MGWYGQSAWRRYALYIVLGMFDGWLTSEGPTHGEGQLAWLLLVLFLWALMGLGILMLTLDQSQKQALRGVLDPRKGHRVIVMVSCILIALAALVRFRNAWFFTHAPLWIFLLVVLGPFVLLDSWFKYRRWRHRGSN